MAETLVKGRDIDMSDGTPRRVVINKSDADSNPALDVNCYAGSGAAIDIQNEGTGPDIKGNGGLWKVEKDGKATFVEVNGAAVKGLDWDTCWSDAVHDHSSAAEGGSGLNVSTLTIIQTSKVSNLNADRLDDCHAGNSSGQIPVSNGTKCTNLYAARAADADNAANATYASNSDRLDNKHFNYFAPDNHTHPYVYSAYYHKHSLSHSVDSYTVVNDFDTVDQSISRTFSGDGNEVPVWGITSLSKHDGNLGGDNTRVSVGGALQGVNFYDGVGGPYMYTIYYRGRPYYSSGAWRFWTDLQTIGHNTGTVVAYMCGIIDKTTGNPY